MTFMKPLVKASSGNYLAVEWLGLCASTAGGMIGD